MTSEVLRFAADIRALHAFDVGGATTSGAAAPCCIPDIDPCCIVIACANSPPAACVIPGIEE